MCRKCYKIVRADGVILLQDSRALALVNQNTFTSPVGLDSTLTASSNQGVVSPGRDVALQVDISKQKEEIKSASTKMTTTPKKVKAKNNKDKDARGQVMQKVEAEGEQVKVNADGRLGRKRKSTEYKKDTSI